MEETEPPLEELQEHIQKHAEHSRERWISWVALSTALLAALAAFASLLAGHHANEAMIEQMRASDQWAFYQAKGIKGAVLSAKLDLLTAMGHAAGESDRRQVETYREEQKKIEEDAKELENSSRANFSRHSRLAPAITFFQIAIAISAIAVLIQRKQFWYVSLALAVAGIGFLFQGLLSPR